MKSQSSKVPKEMHGQRVDVCAAQIFTELSRKKIKSIIDGGGAFLNKKRVQMAKILVNAGDLLELYWEEISAGAKNAAGLFKVADILLENEDFVVIAKPAGLASQATLTSSTDTAAHELVRSFPSRFKIENLFLVHRLDKETSGAMIFAKNKKSQIYFEALFVQKKIQKSYDAICFFKAKEDKGRIDYPIVKDNLRKNTYRAVLNTPTNVAVQRSGLKGAGEVRSAVTRFEVKKHFSKSNISHIRAFPETGRTHQIRVHFQALGCPIVGDKTYSNGVVGHVFGQKFLRHLLHASSIQFIGPDAVNYEIHCPFPQDFADCLALLESSEQK